MDVDKLEFNETVYEPIFSTSRGSIYFYDKESGLWVRKKKSGEIQDDKNIYVGSVGPDSEALVLQAFANLDRGVVRGFIPEFVVGREPFGIGLEERSISPKDIIKLANDEIRVSKDLQDQLGMHLGHVISEIYREFNILKEYGLK